VDFQLFGLRAQYEVASLFVMIVSDCFAACLFIDRKEKKENGDAVLGHELDINVLDDCLL
jgi:hypothetical protein